MNTFIRHLRISIGPLEDGRVVIYNSNGDRSSIRTDVVINSSIMGIPNPSEIVIYNLSQNTQNSIKRGLTKIVVECGVSSVNSSSVSYGKVFEGNIMTVENSHSGVENICRLTALPGYVSYVTAAVSKSYTEGAYVSNILRDVVESMNNISIDDVSLGKLSKRLTRGGYSFAGRSIDCLNELAGLYGFCWRIDNNIFVVQDDSMNISGKSYRVSGDGGGLISLSPILQGVNQILTGVKAEIYYTPGIKAGSVVDISSKYSSNLNGKYIIHTCSTQLSAFENNWKSSMECFRR